MESNNEPLRIGNWLVEPRLNLISQKAKHVNLRPQAMDLLIYLASRRGEVFSADTLIDEVWEGVTVSSGSVYNCINELRQAFGDDPHNPEYFETIPKRGYRLIAPVRIAEEQNGVADVPQVAAAKSRTDMKKALGLAGVLALALVVTFFLFPDATDAPSPAISERSIVVLPFKDLSPEGDQEYFTDGITEELLNTLAGVEGLQVAARTSSFYFKDGRPSVREIGQTLGVAHILEGSVRRTGDRIRVTAQLIDAKTGFHLWSETYDRELTDIFAVQDEISTAIVAALSEKLGLTMVSAPKLQRTANSAAYDAYLLGLLEANRRTGASLEAAKEHFERALELDPGYAPAHARLSITLGLLPQYNLRYTIASIGETRAYHVERAMALAPDAPESLAAKGFQAWHTGGSFREARATLERAFELNPSYTDVLIWLAYISLQLGDYQAYLDLNAQALRIDPLNPLTVSNNSYMLHNIGRFDESIVLIERLRTISPQRYWYRLGDLARLRDGRIAEATIYYLEQLAVNPDDPRGRYQLAEMLRFGLGLADETSGFDHGHWGVMIENGQIEEVLRKAEEFGAAYNSRPMGQVLLAAGRPGEAVGYLNQDWDQALAVATVDLIGPEVLVYIGRARQMTGDQAGGEEALEAALAVIARRQAVGTSLPRLDWDEGVARYFLGQKEAGLQLVARSVERKFTGYMLQPQFQPLIEDPGFAPILAAREAFTAIARDKFLSIVCNDGNPAPEVWTPLPETCEGYVEAAD